ncbi:unnamed protein product [Phaedon cochleariae]|uniref:Fibroin heavy chain-like n=1 Tax=Phaedon cochleariae TaxID=80249 RepID=A0A9P0DUV8_PHACE|nr:unnamed protein product [Phaedon cochleariae]
MKPKIQSSLLFLIIASVGSSQAHGVKGVFKQSYNSASASSSASAFSSSSSYSSDGSIGINDLTNPSNNNLAAVATASAEAGSNGAIAKAGSGSNSASGTLHSSVDSNTNAGAKILSLGQGTYHPDLASSGSYSGSGTLHSGGDTAGGNKILSLGQGAYHPDLASSGSYSGSGTLHSGVDTAGGNKGQGAYHSAPGKEGCCKGPFPGPIGSIYDFKPAPANGGNPPLVHVLPTTTSAPYNGVQVNYGSNNIEGSSGLSYNLIHSLPGPTGSIYDFKPASQASSGTFSSGSSYGSNAGSNYGSQVQPSQPSINGDVYGSFPGKPGSIHDSKPVGGCSGPSCPGSQGYSGSSYGHQAPSVDIQAPLPGTPGSISFTGIKPVSSNEPGIYQICSGASCDQSSTSFGPIEPDCSGGKCKSGSSGNGGLYHSVSTGGSYNKHTSGQGIDLSKPSYEKPLGCSGSSCNLGPIPGPSGCSGPACSSQPSIPTYGSYGEHNPSYESYDQKPVCSGAACKPGPIAQSGYYPGSYDQRPSGINIDLSNPNSGQFGCSGSSCGSQPASGSSGSYPDVPHNKHTQITGIDLSKQKPSGCSGISCNLGPISGGQGCSGSSCGTYPSVPAAASSAYDQKPICSGVSCNLGPQPAVPTGGSYDQYPSSVSTIPAYPPYDKKPIGCQGSSCNSGATSGSHSGSSAGSHSDSSSQHGSSTHIDLSPSYDQKPLIECSGASCDLGLVPKPCSGSSCSPQPTAGSPYIECSGDSCDLGPIPGIYGCSDSSCEPKSTGDADDFHNSLIDVRNGESTGHSQLSGGSLPGISGGSYHTSNIAPSSMVVPIIPVTSGGTVGASSTGISGTYVKETPIVYPGTGNIPLEPSSSSYGNYDDSKGTNNLVNHTPTPVCSGNACKSQQQGGINSGYAGGNVVIQKSDGTEHSVVDGNEFNSGSHKLHGGSGSYSGSFSGGTSGSSGCTNGNCGLPSLGSGSGSVGAFGHGYSGSSSGSFGGVKGGSGSFSSSGSFAGAGGLKPLSDVLGLGGAFSKSGSFSSSRSFSKSEASAASSAFSGSYSSAVAGSY